MFAKIKNQSVGSDEITVVVQGAVDPVCTTKCLSSVRKHLPNAEIILSTWEGTDVSDLDYDEVILNEDPGSFMMSGFEKNNVRRQIYSTIKGIKQARKKYILKIRSDIKLKNANFLKYFNRFNDYDQRWHFLQGRIIIPSTVSRDPRIWESPMCPSDWCSFGLKSDMLNLWDIDFPTHEEEEWFKRHPKPKIVSDIYPSLVSRFNPEQFIWIGFVKKHVKELHSDHMFDVNPQSITETLKSFANNLIVLSLCQFGLKPLKPARKGSDRWHVITYRNFLQIYNKYSNGHRFIPPIDWQRILLFKYFKYSTKRLLMIAKKQNNVAEFLKKEAKYISPFLYFLVKPYIHWQRRKEKRAQNLESWEVVSGTQKPSFSVVIPTHGNLGYFSQALDSLKNQLYRDFEIVVSDDTPQRRERKRIQRMLRKLNSETLLDVRYIFTKASLGQSKNMNQGLSHIRGTWVRILHDDDLLSPSVLRDEYNLIQRYVNAIALFHDPIPFRKKIDYSVVDSSFRVLEWSALTTIQTHLHRRCPVPSSLVFRSDLMDKIGKFDPSLCRAVDWDFWRRIVLFAHGTGNTLIYIQDKNVFYRIHNKSNTNKIKTKLKNYGEYRDIAKKTEASLKALSSVPPLLIDYYVSQALIYRKTRLVDDYFSLPWWWRIYYWGKFRELLKSRV